MGQKLRKQRRAQESFGVTFFSSHEAAERFRPPVEGYPPKWHQWAGQLHAIYSVENGKESLDILPLGYDQQISAEHTSTTVELRAGAKAKPNCKLEVKGRCLMAVMEPLAYPHSALKQKLFGSITLKGTIGADGRVGDLRVIHADISPGSAKEVLANAATRNLRSWQFDARDHTDSLQMTYSYRADTALPARVDTRVYWNLPSAVIIAARPLK